MKIGIVTFHRAHNYGAMLQAVALRLFLKQYSQNVYFVDYKPKYLENEYKMFSWNRLRKANLKGKVEYVLKYARHFSEIKERQSAFMGFIHSEIDPYCKPMSDVFDVVFYGSDQIWRRNAAINGYDWVYFGNNEIKSHFKYPYAASMGNLEVKPEDEKEMREMVENFNMLSVREDYLKDYLSQICRKEIYQVIDPTLLLTAEEWKKWRNVKNSSEPYVLFYDLRSNSINEEEVYKFAERNSLKVEHLVGNVFKRSKKPLSSTDGPYEFYDKIMNADFVFTSSFHGVALSIIFRKQFIAAFNNNSGRAVSLLNSLGLEKRILSSGSALPMSFEMINYDEVIDRLKQLQSDSGSYILKCLNDAK